MKITWHADKKYLSELKPYSKNPRTFTKKGMEDLGKSLDKFGLADPIIINTDAVVIGGHARLEALKQKNIKEKINVIIPNRKLSEKEIKELNIRLNKNIAGEFDFDILANEFELEDLLDWGFEEKELDINLWKEEIPEEKLDEVPEPQKEAVSKLGDIFLLDGKHRVMCGDSTKKEDAEKLMDGKRSIISFQSPPYNAGDNSLGGNKKMKESKYLNDNDNKSNDEYLSFISLFTSISLDVSELTFVNIQQLAGNKKAVIEYLYAFREHYVDKSVWFKGGGQPAMAESVMNSRFEDVYIFDCNKNPNRVIRTGKFRNISNVFEYNPSGKNESKGLHAAVYPVSFAKHYISFATQINAIVLDFFLGSGTTLIACEQTNRICYGMEIDPIYIDVILRRYHNLYPDKKIECLTRDFDFNKLWQDQKNK